MAGTRVRRGQDADTSGIEELRFDFDAERDEQAPAAARPSATASAPVRRGGGHPVEVGGARLLSVVAPEPGKPPEPALLAVVEEVPEGDIQLDPPVPEEGVVSRALGPAPGSVSDAALSITDFYGRVRGALREAFPDELWVTGEICKVTTSRGHHYLELADHLEGPSRQAGDGPVTGRNGPGTRNGAATLEVACWARDWPVVQYDLAAVGVELVPGLVVRIRGKVSVWEGGSRLRFSMTALDVEALVGGIAAARRRLLGALEAEDLLEANRRLPLALVPLRIGLVTSPGSEAYRDFTGQLERSGYNFEVRFEPSVVQGPEAPAQIAGALARLEMLDPQLVVLVRGGGAKGDLAAFDTELVARAIASARCPVWTGIGHTGDRSVADEVAQKALVTPTQCGEAVVAVVAAYLEGVDRRSRQLARRIGLCLDEASRNLVASRSAVRRAAREALSLSSLELRGAESRIANAALVAIEKSQARLANRAQRLAAPPSQQLAVQEQHVAHQRELLALLDPRRQLERGWSLTRDQAGRVVRSSSALARGDKLVTTFAEGRAVSVVDETMSGQGTTTASDTTERR